MGNYSKLLGSIVGGVLGIAVVKGALPAELASPDNVNLIIGGIGSVVTIGAALATYLFPANKSPPG